MVRNENKHQGLLLYRILAVGINIIYTHNWPCVRGGYFLLFPRFPGDRETETERGQGNNYSISGYYFEEGENPMCCS
jgi:hypothetical protein